MHLTRTLRRSVVLALLALVAAAPTAGAITSKLSAPITRGGKVVGRATATFATTDTGWAVLDAKATDFRVTDANLYWRARTTVRSGCAPAGSVGTGGIDGDVGAGYVPFTFSSRWRQANIPASTGTMPTNDVVRECPAGKAPAGGVTVELVIQDAAGVLMAGRARLLSAG